MTKYSKYKDFNLRKRLKENESNIFILKSFLLNKKTSKKIRFKIMLKIHKLYTGLLGNKYKNRCMSSTKVSLFLHRSFLFFLNCVKQRLQLSI